MKKLVLLAALPLFASLDGYSQKSRAADPTPPNYGRCDPFPLHQNALVLHYIFSNSVALAQVPDISGYQNHGNPTGGGGVLPDTDAGGNPNCAYRFPGQSGEHIQIPSSTDFDFATAPATISLWYLPEETLGGKYELLAGRGLGLHCPDTYGEFSLGLYDCRKPVAGMNQKNCWDWNPMLLFPTNCNAQTTYYHNDKWQHVVAVYDYSPAGTVVPTAVYWNGAAINYISPGTCGPLSLNAGDFYIGDDFRGKIDEVRIYKVPFDPSEVAALYEYGIMGCCDEIEGKPAGNTSLLQAEDHESLKTYPNPFTDELRIDVPERFIGGQIIIYNATGQKIKESNIKSSRELMNLAELPAGIYLLECSFGKERIQQKLTKQ